MSDEKAAGTVLYDDSCGVCRRWVPFWAGTLSQRGFRIDTLQTSGFRQQFGMSTEAWQSDLRLVLPDGSQVVGADAYRYVLARIPWAFPISLFAHLPLSRSVFDWSYRVFADNRHRISSRCRVPPAGESARHDATVESDPHDPAAPS